MAITQADLDALLAAILRGVKRVQQDGQTVEYQSIEDMLKAYYLGQSVIATAAGLHGSTASYVRIVSRPGCLKW
jgi:hypothetical protein